MTPPNIRVKFRINIYTYVHTLKIRIWEQSYQDLREIKYFCFDVKEDYERKKYDKALKILEREQTSEIKWYSKVLINREKWKNK